LDQVIKRVVDCISVTTRYPVKILKAEADLENDLGIDSVKRLEIVVALEKEFGLELSSQPALEKEFGLELSSQPRDPAIRTIADIAGWVQRNMAPAVNGAAAAVSAVPAAAPVQALAPQQSPLPTPVSTPPTPAANPTIPAIASTRMDHSNGNGFHGTNGSHSQPSLPTPHFSNGASSAAHSVSSHSVAPLPAVNGEHGRSLAGKIAFVTGSGRGVGKITARLLASKGATVIVNSFHSRDMGDQTVAEINASGGRAVHVWGSVANPQHVQNMFDQIESQFGGLDILICNASNGRIGSFLELSSEDWDRAFRTNVSGHHQCAVRAASLMQRRGGGSIVTMSAVGAHRYIDGLGSQGIVKAAVESMTRYLACELGSYGIRVNCVVGGPVYGELMDKFPNAKATQDHFAAVAPDGKLTSPIDLANTIAFLVSSDAAGINGAVWKVDHGFTAMSSGQPVPSPSVSRLVPQSI